MFVAGLNPVAAQALELGFHALLSAELSDNVNAANSPDEESGLTASGLIGIYGEQRSRNVDAGFTGEIETRRLLSDGDADFNTLTRFLGAADFSLSPRSWRWYVGDILGGVRVDNAVQTIDESTIARRNIFVTGPSFDYTVQGRSRTHARLQYVRQTEDADELETLYTASFRHEHETTPGSYFGISVGDIYTDLPANAAVAGLNSSDDYNRSTASIFWNRVTGLVELYGEAGSTHYDTDEESLDGFTTRLRITRRLGPKTAISLSLGRDLNDQTLSTIESLIASGSDAIAVRPEVAGFYEETRVGLSYTYQSTFTSVDLGVGLAQFDYRLLTSEVPNGLTADLEDHLQGSAFASLSRHLSNRLRGELGFSYERQDYDNRVDETDSILASALLVYRLSTSFELEGGLVHDSASGRLTRFPDGVGVEEAVDITENRATLGIRWAPPSRASQDMTVELKSLLP